MSAQGSGPPRLRPTGHRRTLVWLAPVLTAAQATQTRAISTRRFVYLIIGPPDSPAGRRLDKLVKATDAKARLRLVPDGTGNIPAGAKAYAEERISDTLADMREQGFFDPRWLLDNRSESLPFVHWPDAAAWLDAVRDQADGFALDRQDGQAVRVEVWTEAADTMADLREVCEPFGVSLYSSSGTSTVGSIDRLGRRILADTLARPHPERPGAWLPRPTVIVYVGDGDPPGMAIPDRIETAAVWAHRWFREREVRQRHPHLSASVAWRVACAMVGDDPGPFEVRTMRVAVTLDDLDEYDDATSTVSAKVAEQYARWWPAGENRTLQVEALPVEVIVARVRAALERLFDDDALEAVGEREEHEHERARSAIGEPDDNEDDDLDDEDGEP